MGDKLEVVRQELLDPLQTAAFFDPTRHRAEQLPQAAVNRRIRRILPHVLRVLEHFPQAAEYRHVHIRVVQVEQLTERRNGAYTTNVIVVRAAYSPDHFSGPFVSPI